MKMKITVGIVLLLALSFALLAQNAQELYQRGLVQENANGNLSEAIKLYSQAAKSAGKDRALAAKALIRVAGCEEKLGHQAEATNAYAEVVRVYPEQRTEAATAQDRLNQLRKTSSASSPAAPTSGQTDVFFLTGPLFESYCVSCHNPTNRAGGLDLSTLNARNVGENAQLWETLLSRLRARRDPPAGFPRPDDKTYRAVILRLEQALDSTYTTNSPLSLDDKVTDAELATRMAGLIWGGAPDVSLLDDARSGRLRNAEVLNRQVIRMLRDVKSGHLISNFLEPWLSIDQIRNASIDPELRQSMETEARLFLETQLREDHGVLELWTAKYSFVNELLARHYGINGISGKDFQRVTWRDANRAGILGMAGPLTALSFPSRTSPVNRGIYVFRKFLGMNPSDPPANVPPLAESPAARGQSARERLAAHQSVPICANCHMPFDPLGLALENFDNVGQWRTVDGGTPIDASGTFIDGTRFNGPAELREGLLKYSDAYYANITQQLLSHALNRKGRGGRLYDYEMPSARAIVRSAAAKDNRWSAIISGVVSSPPFQMKSLVP
jgi:hypothetical protein